MKVNPISYGGFEIIAENDAERVWLGQMLGMIQKEHRPFMSHYIRVDLDSMCVTRGKDGVDRPATDMDIEDVVTKDDTYTWGLVDKIEFMASGFYTDQEIVRRIKKLGS